MTTEETETNVPVVISAKDFTFCSRCEGFSEVLIIHHDEDGIGILNYCREHFNESDFKDAPIQTKLITQ